MDAQKEITNAVGAIFGDSFEYVEIPYTNRAEEYFESYTFRRSRTELTITIDKRIYEVSSYLVLHYESNQATDKIYTSASKCILPSEYEEMIATRSKGDSSQTKLGAQIDGEVFTIKMILNFIDSNNISARELEYFYFGYNHGFAQASGYIA